MKIKKMHGVWELALAGLGLGVTSIILATVALVLDEYQGQMVVDSASYNIAGFGLAALLVFAGFLGIIAITLVGFYIIRLLVGVYRGGMGGAGGPM